jgi:hypothetical protein
VLREARSARGPGWMEQVVAQLAGGQESTERAAVVWWRVRSVRPGPLCAALSPAGA